VASCHATTTRLGGTKPRSRSIVIRRKVRAWPKLKKTAWVSGFRTFAGSVSASLEPSPPASTIAHSRRRSSSFPLRRRRARGVLSPIARRRGALGSPCSRDIGRALPSRSPAPCPRLLESLSDSAGTLCATERICWRSRAGRALEHQPYRHIAGRVIPARKKVGRRLADETRRPPPRHAGNPDWMAIAVTGRSYEVVPMRTAFLEAHEAQPV
jgi:hypothetical protein